MQKLLKQSSSKMVLRNGHVSRSLHRVGDGAVYIQHCFTTQTVKINDFYMNAFEQTW